MEKGICHDDEGSRLPKSDRGTAMDDQSKQFIEDSDAVEREGYARLRAERLARTQKKTLTNKSDDQAKKHTKLGAEKLTPDEQRRRFIEAAREAGASEDEADFDAAVKKVAKPQM